MEQGALPETPSFSQVAARPALAEPPHPPTAIHDVGAADGDSGFVQLRKRHRKRASRVNAATPSPHSQRDSGRGWGTRDSHPLRDGCC